METKKSKLVRFKDAAPIEGDLEQQELSLPTGIPPVVGSSVGGPTQEDCAGVKWLEQQQSPRPTGSPPVVGSSFGDTTLIADMTALWAQIGELRSERGNNTALIRDVLNQLAPLRTLNRQLEREAVQRQLEAANTVFVHGFGDGDGFGDGIGVDSGKCNGTRNPILVRYFWVCLGGWTTVVDDKLVFDRCMKSYSTETHGQKTHCDCGVRFHASSGVMVEISQGEKFWYMRAPYPVVGQLDTRPELPLRLWELLVCPRISSKCLVTHQAEGCALFESHEIFRLLPWMQWDEILQFAESLEYLRC
jgi:hypothetical protein